MAVTAVDSCWLYMLHDAHDMNVFSVAYCIYFCFLATVKEMVN